MKIQLKKNVAELKLVAKWLENNGVNYSIIRKNQSVWKSYVFRGYLNENNDLNHIQPFNFQIDNSDQALLFKLTWA